MFKFTILFFALFAMLHSGTAAPQVTPSDPRAPVGNANSTANATATAIATPAIVARSQWADRVVSLHNSYRMHYNASNLTWSNDLYPGSLSWAQQCNFTHSRGRYGENLYAIGSLTADALVRGLDSWMSEVAQYNYTNPGFSSGTGHFTQVVWKDTTQVACAVSNCTAGAIFSTRASQYLVCRYSPPGNYRGRYPANVGTYQA